MLLLFLACAGADDTARGADSRATVDSPAPDDSAEPEDTGPYDCSEPPAPPDVAVLVDTISSSEDFAFAADGGVVHANDRGDVVEEWADGTQLLVYPGFGTSAGGRFLPDGSLVLADVEAGAVDRIGMDGSRSALATGLSYPNGLDVGLDGYVYVAEQTAGQVRRIDPATGESTIIATNLNNPNGISFSPDQDTVYVGSFGGGVVYAVERDGDGWARPRLHAGREGAFALNTDPCTTLAEGDGCYRLGSLGPGTCQRDAWGELACTANPDVGACDGLAAGDACTTTLLGTPYTSVCTTDETGLEFCPAVDSARVTACDGLGLYESCSYGGEAGFCNDSFEDVRACETYTEYNGAYVDGCADAELGDACTFTDPLHPDQGTCQDYASYGYDALLCIPSGGYGSWADGGGGFDALGVDECGNVYVGEYITGHVLRWTDGGEAPETFMELDSQWIPNMHWGLGVGGFEADHLYVMNREVEGGLWDLDVGAHGHPEPWPGP